MYLSKQERDRRYDLVRKAMEKERIDALLVVGNTQSTGSPFYSTGSFRYLTDFFIFSLYGVLLFFQEPDPVMLVPVEHQETFARKYSWINDIRTSSDYVEAVLQIFEEKGIKPRRLGIVSIESIPTPLYLALREEFHKAALVDATPLLLPLRFTKSEEERRLMQKAAEMNDGAYQEVLKRLRPGMKEYEVAGILEGFHRGNGADKTFNLVFSGSYPLTKEGIPFQGLPWCPGQRTIEKGDCVHLEMTTVYGGYWNQLVRILSVGQENAELKRIHQAAVNINRAGVEAIKAGTMMGEAVRVMDRTAGSYGLGLTIPMGHFVGLDLVEGRFDADSEVILEPGAAFILHPRLDDPKGLRIILWGETYLVNGQGAVRLNKTDDTLHTV